VIASNGSGLHVFPKDLLVLLALVPVAVIEGLWGVVQGRRWGGKMKAAFNKTRNGPYQGSIYDSSATFESYGVAHGDREGASLSFESCGSWNCSLSQTFFLFAQQIHGYLIVCNFYFEQLVVTIQFQLHLFLR